MIEYVEYFWKKLTKQKGVFELGTIFRNYKLFLAIGSLILIVWSLKNPNLSSQYVANASTWLLKGLVDKLTVLLYGR